MKFQVTRSREGAGGGDNFLTVCTSLLLEGICFLGAFNNQRVVHVIFVILFCLSACNSTAIPVGILVNLRYWALLRKFVYQLQILMKPGKRMGHDTWRPKYLYTVDRIRKYFVARQQSKRNPLLRFHGNKCHANAPEYYVIRKFAVAAVAQWSRFCAINHKVAGSVPAGVIGIFHWHKILPITLWPWGRRSL